MIKPFFHWVSPYAPEDGLGGWKAMQFHLLRALEVKLGSAQRIAPVEMPEAGIRGNGSSNLPLDADDSRPGFVDSLSVDFRQDIVRDAVAQIHDRGRGLHGAARGDGWPWSLGWLWLERLLPPRAPLVRQIQLCHVCLPSIVVRPYHGTDAFAYFIGPIQPGSVHGH